MPNQQLPVPDGPEKTNALSDGGVTQDATADQPVADSIPAADQPTGEVTRAPRIKRRWVAISIIANIVLIGVILIGAGTATVLHQSDTNPEFCASCHVMQGNVESYLTSNHLDNVHLKAGVQCKDCHSDYTIPNEIASGVNFVTGNYVVDETGELLRRDFGDRICTQCHGSLSEVAVQTDFLFYNPHGTQMGVFECSLCHTSHGEQRDYCNECHESPGQRILGDTSPRSEQIGRPADLYNMYGG